MSNAITLKDFITSSLLDIVNGIRDAQLETGGRGKSPIAASYTSSKHEYDHKSELISQETGIPPAEILQKIEFDIAVTVSRSGSLKASGQGSLKGKIFVASADATVAAELKTEKGDTRISRIKFSVPVLLDGGVHFGLATDKRNLTRMPTPQAAQA